MNESITLHYLNGRGEREGPILIPGYVARQRWALGAKKGWGGVGWKSMDIYMHSLNTPKPWLRISEDKGKGKEGGGSAEGLCRTEGRHTEGL